MEGGRTGEEQVEAAGGPRGGSVGTSASGIGLEEEQERSGGGASGAEAALCSVAHSAALALNIRRLEERRLLESSS